VDQWISRRRFTESMAALAAASLTGLPAFPATGQKDRREQDNPGGQLPSRGEFVVRDAYVMTMDPDLGDIPGGDVHVRNGEIIAVGKAIQTPNASILDGQRMIVLPGLVETHWHMWNTL
jgi:5-methylthioadenosine/S-adenosylhomocysteine deaminase